MIGKDSSTQNLGIVPCAISWLFKLINERKEKMGTRFSVRVSAVEIFGKDEELKDLLSEVSTESVQEGQSPGIHLREDPICGTQVWRIPPPHSFVHWSFHSPCRLYSIRPSRYRSVSVYDLPLPLWDVWLCPVSAWMCFYPPPLSLHPTCLLNPCFIFSSKPSEVLMAFFLPLYWLGCQHSSASTVLAVF